MKTGVEMLAVEQSDRDAVQAFHRLRLNKLMEAIKDEKAGARLGEDEGDAGDLVQAFARHRLDHTHPAATGSVRDPVLACLASLRAAISLLEKGGKKAAPSDKMFAQMLVDYNRAADNLAAALAAAPTPDAAASGGAPAVLPDARALKQECKHKFSGWREHEDGRGGEQVCEHCGLGAMAWTLSLGI